MTAAKVTCESVARAALGEPIRREGVEILYRCPHTEGHANGDAHASLKVNPKKDTWACFVCGVGGTAWALAAFIAGLDPGEKPGVIAWLRDRGLLNGSTSGNGTRRTAHSGKRRIAEFPYSADLRKVRLEPGDNGKPKMFIWEHREGDTWKPGDGGNKDKPLYVNAIFRERDQIGFALAVEGEAKADLAGELGIPAFSFKDLTPAQCAKLAGLDVILWPDKDIPGSNQCNEAGKVIRESQQPRRIRAISPPVELPDSGDIVDAVKVLGWGHAQIEELIRAASAWMPQAFPSTGKGNPLNPFSLAVGMDTLLDGEDDPTEFIEPNIIAKGNITQVFSPRGLGKSMWATCVAVKHAKTGTRVLLIDRDNPRKAVRERLCGFGATRGLPGLKFLSRENAPPLTNTRAWAEFPYYEYDLVILDSLDSAAEGVGEQDSTKPSLAIAPLLDIARRENGPAVLLLGNTIKSAKHSRGSGVVEDRADIVFEVRDATNFHPTGKKPWIEELPAADAGSWTERSTRRKRLSKYRLAFIATKFRIGEEPEPFIIEIDLTTEPWTVRDVTDDVDREGAAARTQAAEERAATVQIATESLKVEILRREASGEPVLLKKQAEDFLVSRDNTRSVAREVIKSPVFETASVAGKGHPKGVRVTCRNNSDGGNSTTTEAAPDAGFSNGDFGRPHPEHTAEIPLNKTSHPCGSQSTSISAEPTLFTLPLKPKMEAEMEAEMEEAAPEKQGLSLARAIEILGGDHPETGTAEELALEARTRPGVDRLATAFPPPRPVVCVYCGKAMPSAVVLARHLDNCKYKGRGEPLISSQRT